MRLLNLKAKYFLYLLLVLFSFTSCCFNGVGKFCNSHQSIIGGINFSTLDQENDDDFIGDQQSKLGGQLGGISLLPLNDDLDFRTGLIYANKGSRSEFDLSDGDEDYGSYDNSLNLNYLQVPLHINYGIDTLGLSFFGGLQPGYLLSAKDKTQFGDQDESTSTITDSFNRFDIGASLGAEYKVSDRFAINTSYDFGLLNINKNDSFEQRNRTWNLNLTYQFTQRNQE